MEHGNASTRSQRTYICIDLKTFYASVECAERGLDPFVVPLVVADESRGTSTICLAISPALKRLGVRNRCRLFDVPASAHALVVRPRMRRYMEVSADIYSIYLRYVSAEDIHPYSIDECFIDATPYLALYKTSAEKFARTLMDAVLEETGIYATAGIGTNLFLAKVALDITAKHAQDGIGYLDDYEFKRTVWHHRPLTDIWGIGPGIARRLEKYGVRDLAGVTRLPRQTLYREFGANAEYLIDHAHGIEPCTIQEIRGYVPESHSLVNGQVLPGTYSYEEARTVLKEMTDASTLDLVAQGLTAGHVSLSVGYAREADGTPPHTGGSHRLPQRSDSYAVLFEHLDALFSQTTMRTRRIKRLTIGFEDLQTAGEQGKTLFSTAETHPPSPSLQREHDLAEAVLAVKDRFGKNSLVKGVSLLEKATGRERNEQIGGHHA